MKVFNLKWALAGIFILAIGCSDELENVTPVISDQSFTVAENASIGTVVGSLDATDSEGDQLIYSIVSGNIDNTFSINASTGEITLNALLDYNALNLFTLEVDVSDGESVAAATVTIIVTQVYGLFEKTINHDDLEREYLLYIPESYTENSSLPVVFSLHGAGGTKESQYELSEFDELADSENFILVTPQSTSLAANLTFWNQNDDPNRADDVGFIEVLIDEIGSSYNADLNRVYIAGSSNGASMALEITCQLSDKIAATTAVKGYLTPNRIDTCNPSSPTSILQMHGTEDPLLPYDGVTATIQFWNSFNQTDADPIVTNLPDNDPNNGNSVIRSLFDNGINGVEVQHLQVIGGEHDWFGEPGTNYDINASEEAWAFFNRFDLNGLR